MMMKTFLELPLNFINVRKKTKSNFSIQNLLVILINDFVLMMKIMIIYLPELRELQILAINIYHLNLFHVKTQLDLDQRLKKIVYQKQNNNSSIQIHQALVIFSLFFTTKKNSYRTNTMKTPSTVKPIHLLIHFLDQIVNFLTLIYRQNS